MVRVSESRKSSDSAPPCKSSVLVASLILNEVLVI